MKKPVGLLLFTVLLLLPAGLVVGLSYTGRSHPVEKTQLVNDGFLEGSVNDVEILFFGFAGCSEICPVSLRKLSDVLEIVNKPDGSANVGGTFVEVRTLAEQPGDTLIADLYSSTFSSRIKGFTPELNTYRQLAEEFVLKVYESRGNSGQLSHTDHFFVLVRDNNRWIVERVLKNSIKKEQLADIISDVVTNY